MNEFVDECRREWRRLGVPDPAADEMAAELAADLDEAEAEGVAAEDVLGTGAFDARSFAAAWAAERGLVRHMPSNAPGRARRLRLPAAIAAVAVVAIVGAVLVLLSSPGTGRLALEPSAGPTEPGVLQRFEDGGVTAVISPVEAPADGAVWIAKPDATARLRLPPTGARVAVNMDDSGDDTSTLGIALLVAGLAGVVSLTLWSSARSAPLRS